MALNPRAEALLTHANEYLNDRERKLAERDLESRGAGVPDEGQLRDNQVQRLKLQAARLLLAVYEPVEGAEHCPLCFSIDADPAPLHLEDGLTSRALASCHCGFIVRIPKIQSKTEPFLDD